MVIATRVILAVQYAFSFAPRVHRPRIDRLRLAVFREPIEPIRLCENSPEKCDDEVAMNCQVTMGASFGTKKENNSVDLSPSLLNSWDTEMDDIVDRNSSLNTRRKSIKFTIRGKPLPLIRHRSSRGFVYNPSASSQELFRDSLLRILPQKYHPRVIDDGITCDEKNNPIVFFSQNEFLDMTIVFRLKRPKSHFVGGKPGPGRIKDGAPGRFHVSRTDIDNMIKFVMDSLNGILYPDDRQVVSLKAIKILDSEGLCQGATDITIAVINDEQFL